MENTEEMIKDHIHILDCKKIGRGRKKEEISKSHIN